MRQREQREQLDHLALQSTLDPMTAANASTTDADDRRRRRRPGWPTCHGRPDAWSSHRHLPEHARRSQHEHGEEHDVSGELAPLRVDLAADQPGRRQGDAAGQRAPQRTEAADDRRPRRRRSGSAGPTNGSNDHADAEQHAGKRHGGDRQRHRDGEDARMSMPISRAASASSDVARNARPSGCACSEQRQRAEHHDRRENVISGIQPMPIVVVDLDRRRLQRAHVETLRVGGVLLEQRVLDDDRRGRTWRRSGTPDRRRRRDRRPAVAAR